ncbi:hypothetical protein BDV17DRAFT_277354 [Aspergillus undulatus]
MVGDHMRIPAVVCFFFFLLIFYYLYLFLPCLISFPFLYLLNPAASDISARLP